MVCGGLKLTMQGFGQHEPLVRPVLHVGSHQISHLTLRNIVFTSEKSPLFGEKRAVPASERSNVLAPIGSSSVKRPPSGMVTSVTMSPPRSRNAPPRVQKRTPVTQRDRGSQCVLCCCRNPIARGSHELLK